MPISEALPELQETRKRNLKRIIEQAGSASALAERLRYTGPSYLSQMLGPHRPITEKTARHMEKVMELPPGWMDQAHETAPPVDRRQRLREMALAPASKGFVVAWVVAAGVVCLLLTKLFLL